MKKKWTDWCDLIEDHFKTTKEEYIVAEEEKPDIHLLGKKHHRERIKKTADWAARNYEGDLIEIGAMHGEQTVHLCEVARKYNRKVIVIDPWDSDINGEEEPLKYFVGNDYEIFLEKTKDYKDVLEIIKLSSTEKEVFDKVENRPLCFAWVDGCHTAKGLHNDLVLISHLNGVIAIDDVNYFQFCNVSKQHYALWNTMVDFCIAKNNLGIHFPLMTEGYVFTDSVFEAHPDISWPNFKIDEEYSKKLLGLTEHLSRGPMAKTGIWYRFGMYNLKSDDEGNWERRRNSVMGRVFAPSAPKSTALGMFDFTKDEL
jgi:hypothetical protein